MQCPLCREREAEARYYRVSNVTEQIEHMCRGCWFALRVHQKDEWTYFKGAGRLILLYTVIPVAVTALLVWLLAILIL